jgi:hypothetical protein
MSDKSRTSNPGAPRGLRDRAGQALAEMVLVTPILLLLVFGIIEFGLAFRTHQIATNSAREGARVAVLPSTTDVETVMRRQALFFLILALVLGGLAAVLALQVLRPGTATPDVAPGEISGGGRRGCQSGPSFGLPGGSR